jgi:hypothetical protein
MNQQIAYIFSKVNLPQRVLKIKLLNHSFCKEDF